MPQPMLRQRSVLSSDDLEAQLQHLEARTAMKAGPQVSMQALLELEGLDQLLDWCSPQPEVRVRIRQTRTIYEQSLWDCYVELWNRMQDGGKLTKEEAAGGAPPPLQVAVIPPPQPPAPKPPPPIPVSPHGQGVGGWETRLPKVGALSEFARILGIPAATLRTWAADGMPAPKTKKGKYKLQRDPVVAWLKKNNKIF